MLEEIRDGFANLSDRGSMLKINALPVQFPAWVFREGAIFGVAVEVAPETTVREKFAGAGLSTEQRVVGDKLRYLLRLESSVQALRNEFAVVCAQMVMPGHDGDTRRCMVADPLGWWERWRQLLGNAAVNQSSYSVLGELLAFERLLQRGISAEWQGPKAGTVDIDAPDAGYEIKSTISRYDSIVHISGQFQLADHESRSLYLIHQRFEPVSSGDSVAAVVDRLEAVGQNRTLLDELMVRCGLEAGSAARSECFRLIESSIYEVDADFPRITNQSFLDSVIPTGVVKIEYQIDLLGLKHQAF